MSMFGAVANADGVDCVLNCNSEFISVSLPSAEAYLHLPIVVSMKWKEKIVFLLLNLM